MDHHIIRHSIIQSELVLGNPQTTQCSGVGICRLFPDKLRNSPTVVSITVQFIIFSNGSVQLQIPHSSLTGCQFRKHFADGRFTIETGIKWPRWMQKKLPATASPGLRAGTYAYRKEDKNLIIHF